MIIGKEVIQRSLMANILKENVQGLQQLRAHVTPTFLPHDAQEKRLHILLQEKKSKTLLSF